MGAWELVRQSGLVVGFDVQVLPTLAPSVVQFDQEASVR